MTGCVGKHRLIVTSCYDGLCWQAQAYCDQVPVWLLISQHLFYQLYVNHDRAVTARIVKQVPVHVDLGHRVHCRRFLFTLTLAQTAFFVNAL